MRRDLTEDVISRDLHRFAISEKERKLNDLAYRPWVTNLATAYDAYWTARNRREDQAAYHEILLFGGVDGYPNAPAWRCALARWARRFACWVEK